VLAMRKKRDAGAVPAAADPPPTTPSTTDAAALEKSFAALDINHDENLDGIEVQRCGCRSADRDGNGEVSKAEYMADGLLGKLPPQHPTSAPVGRPIAQHPKQAPSPAPAPAPVPAPAPGGGLPVGTYNCFGLVGQSYAARGGFKIVDGSHYQLPDGSGAGTYVFDPATKKIRWTSGFYADPTYIKDSWQASPKQISMKTGKDGFYQWDCER
jgi:hypothetical protein